MPEINPACDIFNKFFAEDLLDYNLIETNNTLDVSYSDGSSSRVNINIDSILSLRKQSIPNNFLNNTWYPIFISSDNYIQNKVLSQNGALCNANSSLVSGRIGIENFISFQPRFKNWTISEPSTYMSIDWILNQPDIPYYLNYGILGWFKTFSSNNEDVHVPYNQATLDKFPIGSRLRTQALPNVTLIKLDNETLYRLDRDDHTFDGNEWSHFNPSSLTTIKTKDLISSNQNQNILYYLLPESLSLSEQSIFGDKSQLWIADGDCFSYYDSFQDQQMQRKAKIISRTYVSSCMYKYYTQIYNLITAHKPKLMTSGMPLRELRLCKQLAMVLSTSPFITDFSIYKLNSPEIIDIVRNYTDNGNDRNISDTDQEISHLRYALIQISSIMSDSLDPISNKTATNNLIFSNKSLFQKLLNKYSASLVINKTTNLSYKSLLRYGDNIYINQSSQSLCDKNIKGTEEQLLPVYNNQIIKVNNIDITTNISDTQSDIILKYHNNQKILPLADITKTLSYAADINIVMDFVGDVSSVYRTDNLDLRSLSNTDPSIAIFQWSREKVAEISFSVVHPINNNDYTDTVNQFSYFWEQIEGTNKLYFSDQNISGDIRTATSKFETSTHSNPKVYIDNFDGGRYSIQCTVSGPYGSFIKKKTFFVVQGKQQDLDPITKKMTPNPNYGQYIRKTNNTIEYITPDINENVIIQDSLPISARSDFLRVSNGVLSEIAIEKGGMFWPLKTNLLYRLVSESSNRELSGKIRYYFGNKEEKTANNNSSLSLTYIPNNTLIKLIALKLSNLRNNNEDRVCADCLSMFEPLSSSSSSIIPGTFPLEKREVVLRRAKYNDAITLSRFERDTSSFKEIETITFDFPNITTSNAPSVYSYGGYNTSVINNIGIDIPGLPKPDDTSNGIASENPISLPHITGYDLAAVMDSPKPGLLSAEEDMKLCYQKNLNVSGHTQFSKGVFHPASGWIKHSTPQFDEHKNLSSVLKFNPGARKSYKFIGPGLYGMKASYNRTTFESYPAVYSSTINIGISDDIQWEPACYCNPSEEDISEQYRVTNQKNREYVDQYIGGARNLVHGYRYLAGGNPKIAELRSAREQLVAESMDEFEFSLSYAESSDSSESLGGYGVQYNYNFAVTGPNAKITEDNIANNILREPRVNDLTIQDLEVQLNFLNIANTKNIVVMFESANNAKEPSCPLSYNMGSFVNRNFDSLLFASQIYDKCDSFLTDAPNASYISEEVKQYIDKWLETHKSDYAVHRLCLLNQEHIQNNKYNMSILFSDHASKYNIPYDHNIFMSRYQPNIKQKVIKDGYSLSPTTSALSYSDKDAVVYQNIIRENQINLANNSFVKFKNRSLFANPNPSSVGCPGPSAKQKGTSVSASTPFALKIIVLEELDDMISLDMVNNNSSINGFNTADVVQKSSDIVNSLCSWELILHTDKTRYYTAGNGTGLTNYGNDDVLGLIEYGAEPKYPGYSFIADFSNKKYLIPKVNLNAPHTYINDYAICDFANVINKPIISRLRSPTFPTAAIISIIASLFSGTTGTLLGTATGPGPGYSQGFNAIIDYFNQNRLIEAITETARNIYAPNYDNFPFGSAEKVLINVSKTGGIWYTLEVPIFKYSNCPILDHNRYKFIKLSKNTIPRFSQFSFERLIDIQDIIDTNLIATLSKESIETLQNDATLETMNDLPEITNLEQGDFVEITNSGNTELDGLYVASESQLFNVTNNWLNILKSQKLLTNQSLLNLFPSVAAQGIATISTVIILEGKIPFYIFNAGDDVEYYTDKSDTKTCSITGKALVIKNNQYYTILNTSVDISSASFISPANNDTIVVFKPQTTKSTDIPVNIWGLEKEQISNITPEIGQSTTGLGCYGDGSLFKYKTYLTTNLQKNKLHNIYDIFNNHENNKLTFNDITIIHNDTILPINNTGAAGYAVSVDDITEVFGDNYKLMASSLNDTQYQQLISSLKNKSTNIVNTKYQIIFIKSESLKQNLQDIDYGDISFEQDLIKQLSINYLDQDSIDLVANRLKSLSVNNDQISRFIGQPNRTNNIILNGSIQDLQNHYNYLPEDNTSCYQANSSNCYKTLTKQAIYNKSYEKNELLKLLEIQANKSIDENNNVTYIVKGDNSHILPQVRVDISQHTDNSLSVTYTNQSDKYYWINIDPKQSCSLAEEATVKVLKKTVYRCTYANTLSASAFSQLIPNNNVCINRRFNIKQGVDETATLNSPGEIEYVISDAIVNKQKNEYEEKYADIAGWKEYIVERRFSINDDSADGLPAQDIAVTAIETYDLAIPCVLTDKGIDCPDLKNDGSADMNTVEGNHPSSSSPCDYTNIPGGLGLLTRSTTRMTTPTRVYNIFNLDDINDLKVQFRKIPRKLRGVDFYTTVYKYGVLGNQYRPISTVLPPLELVEGNAMNNNFYYWHCNQADADSRLVPATVTNFMAMQNEMIFRSFFGSLDKIEDKDNLISLFPWEIIPYEYDT